MKTRVYKIQLTGISMRNTYQNEEILSKIRVIENQSQHNEYRADQKRNRQHKTPFNRRANRYRDVCNLIYLRFLDHKLPETDDLFCNYQFLIANAIFCWKDTREEQLSFLINWAKKYADWIPDKLSHFQQLLDKQSARRQMITHQKAGQMLKLKLIERDEIKITEIGPSDISQNEWKALQRLRKNERDKLKKAEKRRLEGKRSQTDIRRNSDSQNKPWEALGISRSKYYSIRKKSKDAITIPFGQPCRPPSEGTWTAASQVSESRNTCDTLVQTLDVGDRAKGVKVAASHILEPSFLDFYPNEEL